ncbi:M23 family metallopeptidase [Catenovulum sp. SM1970]|uniref:M23 family metallopeptidase n=1 Tax=Marinifaba aquimaris TaxID=2741323 RepID=UPI001573E55E|nr:M23 family metallopeptidase [Marinifaba aquimaris]NTS76579.1 M23 family metallopeptidase [Marinifaba aquimaris]
MALSINYKKHDVELEWRLDKRHWIVLLIVMFSLALLTLSVISWLTASPASDNLTPVQKAQNLLADQKQQVEELREQTQLELGALKLKLGELQSQMLRINALGAGLQAKANLEGDEFNFEVLPATGGPASELSLASFGEQNTEHHILTNIDSMLAELEEQERQLGLLESVMMNHDVDVQSYISGRPITSGWLSSYYGMRKDPFSGLPAMHKGIDFAGEEGNKVVATGAGIITWVGERYGYGNLIEIDHGDGLKTRYGHNKAITVSLGDVVTKGQQIGVMGSTGRSTGPHVHYEILKNGKQIDPLKYVYRKQKK